MKKERLFLAIVFVLFLIPFVSSDLGDFIDDVSNIPSNNTTIKNTDTVPENIIKLSKSSYNSGETFQAEISADNLLENLNSKNIKFYKYNTSIEVNLFYDFKKINNKYYVYAILPKLEREYDFALEDIYIMENQKQILKNIRKRFSVSEELAPFNFNPGFIITKDDFFIWVTNNFDTKTNVSLKFSNQTKTLNLFPRQASKVSFSISDLENPGITNLILSGNSNSYSIPVYAVFKIKDSLNQTNATNNTLNITDFNETEVVLRFSPDYIDSKINIKENFLYKINLINPSQTDVRDITFNVPESLEYLEIYPDKIDLLEGGKSRNLSLSFYSVEEGLFEGTVTLETNKNISSPYLDIKIKVEKNATSTSSVVEDQRCEDIGEICEFEEKCSAQITYTIDGECCLGSCKKPGNDNLIVVIILLVLIGIVGFFIYKKSRDNLKKSSKSSDQVLKQRQSNYLEKFKSRGNLSRI